MKFFDLLESHQDFNLIFNGVQFIVNNDIYDNHTLSDFVPFNITMPSSFLFYRFSGKYGSFIETQRNTYYREQNELVESFILRVLKRDRYGIL